MGVDDADSVGPIRPQWAEILAAVSAVARQEDRELWLGQLVIEVQKACDRAVATTDGSAGDLSAGEADSGRNQQAERLREEAVRVLQAALRGVDAEAFAAPESAVGNVEHLALLDHKAKPDPDVAPASGLTAPAERPEPSPVSVLEAAGSEPPPASVVDPEVSEPPPASVADGSPLLSESAPVDGGSIVTADDSVWAPAGEEAVLPAIEPTGIDPAVVPAAARLYLPPPKAWPAHKPPVEEPTVEQPTVEQPTVGEPPVGKQPVEELGPAAQPRVLRLQRRAALTGLAILLATVGLLAYEHFWTAAEEHRAQNHLAAQFAARQIRTPFGAQPVRGSVFASLGVRRLGIDGLQVVEGVSLASLRQGPAHVSTSQVPGETGAVVIVGHRSTYGAPFARLGLLRVGDLISLRTTAGFYLYRVEHPPEVVRPGSGSVQLPSAAQVVASGGPSAGAYQALVLATADSTRGQSQSMKVVVATLDQPSAVNLAPSAGASNVVAEFGVVPGDWIGFLLLVLWLVVMAAVLKLSASLKRRLPATLVSILGGLAVLVCLSEVYLAIDRMVPGTH